MARFLLPWNLQASRSLFSLSLSHSLGHLNNFYRSFFSARNHCLVKSVLKYGCRYSVVRNSRYFVVSLQPLQLSLFFSSFLSSTLCHFVASFLSFILLLTPRIFLFSSRSMYFPFYTSPLCCPARLYSCFSDHSSFTRFFKSALTSRAPNYSRKYIDSCFFLSCILQK